MVINRTKEAELGSGFVLSFFKDLFDASGNYWSLSGPKCLAVRLGTAFCSPSSDSAVKLFGYSVSDGIQPR